MGLCNWIVNEKIDICPRLDQELAERHLPFEELFLDEPVKISAFVAFSLFPLNRPVSNFSIQVSILGACWNNWFLTTCV